MFLFPGHGGVGLPDQGVALEHLDEAEDDSAAEYEDALSSFSEDDLHQAGKPCTDDTQRSGQRNVAASPVAFTSKGGAGDEGQGHMAIDNDERTWYPNTQPKDHHRLSRSDLPSIVIEEESEEDETESLPMGQPIVGQPFIDPMPHLYNQPRPSFGESTPSYKNSPRRHQRYSSFPESDTKSSPFLNVPPRKLHHPRPRYQSQPFSSQFRARPS
jgi:hypothetical protein